MTNEKMTKREGITWIKIEELHSHPDNPRKDLGDLTELAESIKAKGILQNLTVVDRAEGGYTVIIGHRRTAAAKMAGITELPCVIAEMTPAEQVQTMLLENMQRNDLTVYEQAQSFQMLLDLGDTIESISEKTGFSKGTVKKRIKMAALDQNVLKEVSGRQLSLSDFDELYKIDDIEKQNEILKDIGTSNFNQRVQYAIKEQNVKKNLPAVKEYIKKLGARKIERTETYGTKYSRVGCMVRINEWNGTDPLFENIPDKKLYYCLDEHYGEVSLYVEAEKPPVKKKTKEELEKEHRIAEVWQKADALSEEFYNLRKKFIEDFRMTAKTKDEVYKGAVLVGVIANLSWIRSNNGDLWKLAGTTDAEWDVKTVKTIDELYKCEDPAKTVYALFGDLPTNTFINGSKRDYPYHHKNNTALAYLYKWLESIGYEMSDEEKLLRDGEHPIFDAVNEGPEEDGIGEDELLEALKGKYCIEDEE